MRLPAVVFDTSRCEQILDAERNAGERTEFAASARLVGRIGGRERIFRRLDRIGVERPGRRDRRSYTARRSRAP